MKTRAGHLVVAWTAAALSFAGCSGGGGGAIPMQMGGNSGSSGFQGQQLPGAAVVPPGAAVVTPTNQPNAIVASPAAAASAVPPVSTPVASTTLGATSPPVSNVGTSAPPLPLGGLGSSMTAETPLASEALVDSIGVNTHVPSYFSQADFSTVVARFQALGVKHVRDGILDHFPPYDSAMTTLLASSDARLDGITDCPGIEYYPQSPTSPSDIQQFNASIGSRLESVEGPNEVDSRGDATWAADTKACLGGLRSALPSLPFIAPSLADAYDDASQLGDISAGVDSGNIHRYFGGRNPGTLGWGGTNACGVYGALLWAICEAEINAGSKPAIVTETGYNSASEVDEPTQAKYLSRLFFVNLRAGIPRSYIYDFKDYTGGDAFGGDGLIRTDDSPKPAYDAIQAEIAYFTDRGTAPLIPLSYTVQGTHIDHELFMRSDGTYVLALWNETASWSLQSGRAIVVSPTNVTVTLGAPPIGLSAVALNDAGTLVPSAASATVSGFSVAVDDHMTLVKFRAI